MVLALLVHIAHEAQPSVPESPDWQKTISWLLGIPALIAAAVGSIYIVPKLRLENRKTALEIEKMERDLRSAEEQGNSIQAARIVAAPIVEGRRAQDLILRFVFLYLILEAWGLIEGLFGAALSSAQVGLRAATEDQSSVWTSLAYLSFAIVASLPHMVQSLLFVAVGWPILLDISRILNIVLPDFFYTDRARRVLIAVAVIAAFAGNLVGAGTTFFLNLRGI